MKFRILLCYFFTCSTVIFAQENKLKFGLKAGFNFSVFNYSKLPNGLNKTSPDNGVYAGGQFVIRLINKIYLQPEAFYIDSRVQDYDKSGSFYAKEEIKHISTPLLVKVKLGHFGIYAGPQVSFRLSAYLNNIANNKTDVTNNSYTKTNFSGIIGVEYTFRRRFGIDFRYQQGFANIRSTTGLTPLTSQDGQDIKLNGIQAGLYYRIGRYLKK